MSKRIYLLVLVALILFPTGGMAANVIITAEKDAYVSSEFPNSNYGGAGILSVKTDPGMTISYYERAYIKFNLDSIPPDATINLAYLLMYDPATGASFDVSVRYVTSSWFETGANGITWNNMPTSDGTVLDKVPKYAVPGVYTADITSLVTEWHTGSISNHGVVLNKSHIFNTPPGSRFFNSREAATGQPMLFVLYNCESMEIMPEMDSFVSIDDTSANYGSSTDLEIQSRGRWSYLQFGTDSVPAGANVEFARLRMYHYSGSYQFTGFSVGPCRVTTPWDHTAITWVTKPLDTGAPESIKGTVGYLHYSGWLDMTILNMFNGWRNGTFPNYGVVVKYPPDNGSSSSSLLGKFHSSEYAGEEYDPRIEVFYSMPVANVFTAFQNLTPVSFSDAAWGDMDDDGDLDVVLCGSSFSGLVTKTYENYNDSLIVHTNGLPGVQNQGNGCLAWGDMDRDGDLDLAIAGEISDTERITRVYTNDGGGNLTWDTGQVLTDLENASVSWGDVDRDGDLDLYVQGHDGSAAAAILYENDSGTLVPSSQVLTGLYNGSADWADIDGNGRLDLIVTGSTGTERVTECYLDSAGTLVATGPRGLPLVNHSDIALGDVDRDGDRDVAITGSTGAGVQITRVYLNDGTGNFNLMMWEETGLYRSSCAFGDFDNDGYLDVAFCGFDGANSRTHIYRYDNGTYTFFVALTSVNEGSVSWADMDDDGDLDFLLTGKIDFGSRRAIFYNNSMGTTNTRPSPPTEFTTIRHPGFVADTLYLHWSGASDNETWHKGLYYCVQVGTSMNGNDLLSGTYSTPLMGNVGQATQLKISVPKTAQHCYWRVKAIDTGLMASDWSHGQCSWDTDSIWTYKDYPLDDAFVASGSPGVCHGANGDSINLAVGDFMGGSGDVARSYFKFSIADPGGMPFNTKAIQSVHLHAFCTSLTPLPSNYVGVYRVGPDAWSEDSINWYNAPTTFNPYPADVIKVNPGLWGTWCVWDVTEIVLASSNIVTMALRNVDPPEGTPGAITEFFSKENDEGLSKAPYVIITYSTIVGIADGDHPRMQRFSLAQNFPNPFNPQTRLSYTIPDGSTAHPVLLRIFDVAGRLVKTLTDEPQPAGIYLVAWDGSNRNGDQVASGVYFYRLQWNGKSFTRKMVLLR